MKMTLASMLMAGLIAVPTIVRTATGDDKPAASCSSCGGEKMLAMAEDEAPATQPAKWTAYGEPMKLSDKDNVDAAKVLADLKSYEGKQVRLTGDVVGVCKKKGCWMKMSSNGSPLNVFVHFTCPIEGRLIPMEAMGKAAIVEGTLKVKRISEADARHIAEEDGKTAAEVEAIKGEQTQIEIEGPSALVAE